MIKVFNFGFYLRSSNKKFPVAKDFSFFIFFSIFIKSISFIEVEFIVKIKAYKISHNKLYTCFLQCHLFSKYVLLNMKVDQTPWENFPLNVE